MGRTKQIDRRAHQLVSLWVKIHERLFEEELRLHKGRQVEMVLAEDKPKGQLRWNEKNF